MQTIVKLIDTLHGPTAIQDKIITPLVRLQIYVLDNMPINITPSGLTTVGQITLYNVLHQHFEIHVLGIILHIVITDSVVGETTTIYLEKYGLW